MEYACYSWAGFRVDLLYSLTSLDTSHDSCPSLGVSHSAGQLDGDLHRDSPLSITTKLVFVLQIKEITVTEIKFMCWQVFSCKYICNRLFVLEYIALWTRRVVLVVTIANSRSGAPMKGNVANVIRDDVTIVAIDFEWNNDTQTKQLRDMRLTSRLYRVSTIFLCEYDLTWSRTESQVRLSPGPSQVLSQVSSQDSWWIRPQRPLLLTWFNLNPSMNK